jgi:hypothetical protein
VGRRKGERVSQGKKEAALVSVKNPDSLAPPLIKGGEEEKDF